MQDAASSARIQVRRSGGWSSRYRAFKIVIDDELAAELRRGEDTTLYVSPGHHQVWVTIDWCRSRKLELDVADGETVSLICRTRPTDPLLALYIVTLGRNRYPVLEHAEQQRAGSDA